MRKKVHVLIHEYNSVYLILSKTLQPQFISRSNNYAAKSIWFREEIVKRGINLFKTDKVEN